jgi:hypothetical protein
MSRESSVSSPGNPREQPPSTSGETSLAKESTTVYAGHRDPGMPVGEACSVTVEGNSLDCRYDLLSASPSGFEWGYGGSGPAQLAIAILAHAYDDEFATTHYQQFKRDVVAGLPENDWTLTKGDLDEWRREVVDDA